MEADHDSTEQILLAASFEVSDLDHLVVLMADLLDRLIAHNDQIPLVSAALTRFHSRTPPAITVLDYLRRIVRYTNVERSCLLITLHYIDHISARMPQFTISSLTVHRFLISSITISSKALCDAFCTNVHYAKVGGIRLGELNLLEKEFLAAIDWRLTCTREVLQAYYVKLARTHSTGRFKLPDSPPATIIASPRSGSNSPGSSMVSNSPPDVHMQVEGSNQSTIISPPFLPPLPRTPSIPISPRSSPHMTITTMSSNESPTSPSRANRVRSPLTIPRRRSLLNSSSSPVPLSRVSPSPRLRAEKRHRSSPLVEFSVENLRPRGRRRIEPEQHRHSMS